MPKSAVPNSSLLLETFVGMIAFTANVTDHSTTNGFQFEFHCDHCNNGFMSQFQPSKIGLAGNLLRAASGLFGGSLEQIAGAGDQVKDAFRGQARDKAFEAAVAEGKTHFRQCSRCGKWVCPEHCWNAERSLCEGCAPDLQEEIAAAQATVMKEQVWEKARQADLVGDINIKADRVASCPHCGAKAEGTKFCPECGKPLRPKGQCGKCGAQAGPNSKFCPECGEKL